MSADVYDRFTGPKITLDINDLSEEQEKALAEEGLEINLEGRELETPDDGEMDMHPVEKAPEKESESA